MIINVGTKNIQKLSAVKDALNMYPMFEGVRMVSRKVSSEVSDQPKTLEEINTGAMNRAGNVFRESPCDYGFGIESGIVNDIYVRSKYLDYCVCAIYNGKEMYLGRSSAFEVPKNIIDTIMTLNIDLSEACKILGMGDKIGSEEGLVGILTNKRITRKDQIIQAIQMSMAPLENRDFYPR